MNTSSMPHMRDTPWRVTLTRNALNSIKKIIDRDKQEKLFGFLTRLAHGYTPNKCTRSCVLNHRNVVKSRVVAENIAVVWAVALDTTEYYYTQVIQIYEIVWRNEIAQAICRVQSALSHHTELYLQSILKTVREECPNAKIRRRVPLSFPKVPKILWHRNLKEKATDGNVEALNYGEIEDSLTLAKKYRLTEDVIRRSFENALCDVELPMILTEDELEIVNKRESLFILGRSGTGKTTVMLMRIFQQEQAYYAQIDSYEKKPIQMLFTFSSKLCETINKYYSKLSKSIEQRDLQDLQDQTNQDRDYSEEDIRLKDLKNPSFICFGDFLKMMDRELEDPLLPVNRRLRDYAIEGSDEEDGYERRVTLSQNRTWVDHQEVNFVSFLKIYWGHLNRRNYDPSSIWIEFQSSIKGSLESLLYPKGKLPLDAYLSLADRRDSSFSVEDRQNIYKLFRAYERMKGNDWDIGDLTSHIFLELSKHGYHGPDIDYVYIDEVQDLTPAQIALFKFVCHSRYGFCFAGDTAQTISAGVGFRFNSVKDLFYKDILPHIDPTFTDAAELVPDLCILTENYRTHSGVLNLAGCVLEMLYQAFPSTVDKLPKEESIIDGPIPLFLKEQDINDMILHCFGLGETPQQDFGAEQAIIVRDEATRKKLSQKIGQAMILTVYEAKGLEYEDVLCYDFFACSEFSKWRVLYAFDSTIPENHPAFDMETYRMLCYELKALYVVITRCKGRLWFFDSNLENREPILNIWEWQNIIKVVDKYTVDNEIKPLAQKSSPEMWHRQAEIFFEKSMYERAKQAFSYAKEYQRERHCDALIAEQEGKFLASGGQIKMARQEYFKAAIIFEQLGYLRQATLDYMAAQEYKRAYEIYLDQHEYRGALNCCLAGKLHTEALNIFCMDNVDSSLKRDWSRKFAFSSHLVGDVEIMLRFLGHVESDDIRAFLQKHEHYDELIDFDKKQGHWDRVASGYEDKKDLFNAVHYWKMHNGNDVNNVELIRVLLRMARPYYFFASAGISFDSSSNGGIRKLICNIPIPEDYSDTSFEFRFLIHLLDATTHTNIDLWQSLRHEAEMQKKADLTWIALFLIWRILPQPEIWKNIILVENCYWTFAKFSLNLKKFGEGLKQYGQELEERYMPLENLRKQVNYEQNKKLKEAEEEIDNIRENIKKLKESDKHECYRIFGLEDAEDLEYCTVNENIWLAVDYSSKDGESYHLHLEKEFSRRKVKISNFVTKIRNFFDDLIKNGNSLPELEEKAKSLQLCSTLLLADDVICGNEYCCGVHNKNTYLQREEDLFRLQISMASIAESLHDTRPWYSKRYRKYTDQLFEMFYSIVTKPFDPSTIMRHKYSKRVARIFRYKQNNPELDKTRFVMALLLSQASSSQGNAKLPPSKLVDNEIGLRMLLDAFSALQVQDSKHSKDLFLKSGSMGVRGLYEISGLSYKPISLPPRVYIPLLEIFLTILVVRSGSFRMNCLPVRLWADITYGDKLDTILTYKMQNRWKQMINLKDILCFFLKDNAKYLMTWFKDYYSPEPEGDPLSEAERHHLEAEIHGQLLRILSLIFILYINFRPFRKEISKCLMSVDWKTIEHLGPFCGLLQQLKLAKKQTDITSYILAIVRSLKEEFVVIAIRSARVPPYLWGIRQIRIDIHRPTKWMLRDRFKPFTASSPVVQRIKLPPKISQRIFEVLATVRQKIKNRDAITTIKERYQNIAKEYFEKRAAPPAFLSFYVDTICVLRVEFKNILKEIDLFLIEPDDVEDNFEATINTELSFRKFFRQYQKELNDISLGEADEISLTNTDEVPLEEHSDREKLEPIIDKMKNFGNLDDISLGEADEISLTNPDEVPLEEHSDREKLEPIIDKMKNFGNPDEEHKFEFIIDELLSFGEIAEEYLERLDVNNSSFLSKFGQNHAEKIEKEAREHLRKMADFWGLVKLLREFAFDWERHGGDFLFFLHNI